MPISPEEVNNKFLNVVLSRSGGGILGLARNFRIIDSDRSGQLSKDEFKLAMKKFRVGLTEEEVSVLFGVYDVDKSGTIEFGEFLKGLRSKLSPQRRALVEQAFLAMDSNGSGEIDYEDLKDKYDTRHHPKVQSGEWTAKQAIDEFIGIFEGDKGNNDKVVTKEEFLDYHTGLSANIDTDDEFGIMMSNNWGIEYIPQKNIEALFEIIRNKAEQKSGNKKPKRVAEDIFRFFDKNGSKEIDMDEFREAMSSFGAGLNEKELKTLFRMFDHDGSGEISYQELVDLVWGAGK
jgi:Ca2+-binding EF-hand superfamily protein